MAEKPILFNSEMVRAVLNGTKTQTRRVIKPQPPRDKKRWLWWRYMERDGNNWYATWGESESKPIFLAKPPFQEGDTLWVREAWATADVDDNLKPSQLFPPDHSCPSPIYYAATQDFSELPMCGKTRPSIFMPRWASRITLRVTAVRVERLQDISREDVLAEGISGYSPPSPDDPRERDLFIYLWDSINAKRGDYETDELWLPSVELQKGVYEFSFDGGDWEKWFYWPHWYDSITDEWVGPCVGDDPEAIDFDVIDMTKTLVKLPSGEAVTFRQKCLSRKTMKLNYGWDSNPWVWVVEFERVTP